MRVTSTPNIDLKIELAPAMSSVNLSALQGLLPLLVQSQRLSEGPQLPKRLRAPLVSRAAPENLWTFCGL